MSQKAQGLSINTIIIAAIALIVLVVLIAIFTGRLGIFSKGITETGTCISLGGSCKDNCDLNNRMVGALDCDRDFDGDGKLEHPNEPYCCKS